MAVLHDIADEIESGVPWQLGSTLEDAEDWIRQAPDDKKDELDSVLERLRSALAERN